MLIRPTLNGISSLLESGCARAEMPSSEIAAAKDEMICIFFNWQLLTSDFVESGDDITQYSSLHDP